MPGQAVPVYVTAAILLAGLAIGRRADFLTLRWQPDRHLAAALGTGVLAVVLSAAILAVPQNGPVARALLFVGIYGVCGCLLPWTWVTRVERRGAEALALRRDGLLTSIAIGILAGAALFTRVWTQVDWSSVDPVYFAVASANLLAGGLFELFLYFGFIHLRLERCFGSLPAVVGSAAIYSLWHVGTELPMHPDAWQGLVLLFGVGLMYHAAFQLTHHLALIWPFFFFGGVWIDFGVNLGFPPEIAQAPGWIALSWGILLLAPLVLLRTRPR